MRATALLWCLVCLAPIGVLAQDRSDAERPTRKGDTLSVKGCLSGTSLQATDLSAPDATALLAEGLTFRLSGDKALLKELRHKHDRRLVEVTGVLKSELPKAGSHGLSNGRMRIVIGAAPSGPGRMETENRRSLPVLDVKSFEGGQTACMR